MYRFDPRRIAAGEPPLVVDMPGGKIPVQDYMRNEARFRMVERIDPERFGDLARRSQRAAETANRLREDVLEPVGHAQWVFTVPKMLRPYFLRHLELLGELCRAAWQTVREMMVAAAGEEIRPGMVAVIQTFGSTINFHPHVHAVVSRGGWTQGGQWVPAPMG